MCMIVHVPSDAPALSLNVFHELDRSNPHGIGVAAPDPTTGRLSTFRTLDNVRAAWESHLAAHARGVAVTVHWRYTTHGVTSLGNVHPFPLPAGGVLFHNGMLPVDPSDRKLSDTAQAAADCRRLGIDPFSRDAARRDAARRILAAVGDGSRLLALSRHGDVWTAGDWLTDMHGRLWSNSGCSLAPKPPARRWTGRGWELERDPWGDEPRDDARGAAAESARVFLDAEDAPLALADVRLVANRTGTRLFPLCVSCRIVYDIDPADVGEPAGGDTPCDECGDHDDTTP